MTVFTPKVQACLNVVRVVRDDCQSTSQNVNLTIVPSTLDPFFVPQSHHYTLSKPSTPEELRKHLFPDFTPDAKEYTRLLSQKRCCTSAVFGESSEGETSVLSPVRCKSWDCKTCGPFKREKYIDKAISGKPEREMTLTMNAKNCHDPAQAARFLKRAFRRLVPRIRKKFGSFEYFAVWELTHKGTPHLHVLFRGKYIPQKWLGIAWHGCGGGYIVDIRSLKSVPARAFHATKYLGKSTGQTAHAIAPLHVVQISKYYLLPPDPKPLESKYKDYHWTHSPRSVPELIALWKNNPRYLSHTMRKDGSCVMRFKPRKLPPELVDHPEIWANDPFDLALNSYVEI